MSHDILKILDLLFRKSRGLGGKAHGYHIILPFDYNISREKLKIHIKIHICILQDSRTTKLGWEEICSEM